VAGNGDIFDGITGITHEELLKNAAAFAADMK
jgi:hypothetical protein